MGLKPQRNALKTRKNYCSGDFGTLKKKNSSKAGEVIGPAQVYGGVKGSADLASTTDVKALLPHGGTAKLSGKIVMKGLFQRPLSPQARRWAVW